MFGKTSLLMLNQTTGKARDYVFESIPENELWTGACDSLKNRFESVQVKHDARRRTTILTKIKPDKVEGSEHVCQMEIKSLAKKMRIIS
jgi:hypothetical protein